MTHICDIHVHINICHICLHMCAHRITKTKLTLILTLTLIPTVTLLTMDSHGCRRVSVCPSVTSRYSTEY